MGYKDLGKELSFADLAVANSMENNRSVKMMERINQAVRWRNIEALLMENTTRLGRAKREQTPFPHCC